MNIWDQRFMKLAQEVSTWSKDPSTWVGAVIVDEDRIVCGMGYNGFPRRVRDTKERYEDRATKYKMIVHAEVNAILNSPTGARDCTLYSTKFPCAQCAAMIIQAGVKAIVSPPGNDPRWEEEQKLARTMFAEAGIDLFTWPFGGAL